MNALKKHGKFIGFVVVLIGLLWFADGEIDVMSKSVEARRQSAKNLLGRNLKKLFTDAKASNGEPATVANRRILDVTQTKKQTSRERNQRISFETTPTYTLASLGGNAKEGAVGYYRERDLALRSKLQYLRYITIPNIRDNNALGFSEPTKGEMTPEQVKDLLRKMDIVECVVESAGRSKVQRLDKFKFGNSKSDDMFAAGIPAKPLAGESKAFIEGDVLEVTINATEEALYNFMIDLQRPEKSGRPNRYLSVWEFKLEKQDLLSPVDNYINAVITIVALKVDENSSYPADEAKQAVQQTNNGGGRRFR
ncbi:hypothetical protein OAU50_03860 [Planctomycetota bacterium]|nr:hypothetical protein [Planctomycetota bacterium]